MQDGSESSEIATRGHVSTRGSGGYLSATRAMSSRWAKLRIDYGPGYRVYFIQQGDRLVILLAGGDKRTQDRDIRAAIELARAL